MLYESLRALSWFASFILFSFPAIERSRLLVLPKSVTESVRAQFDLTREMIHERLETRAEAGSCPQHNDGFVGHILRNHDDANNQGMSVLELEVTLNRPLCTSHATSAPSSKKDSASPRLFLKV